VLSVAEVPEPSVGPGEVVIDVELANITFVETQVRAGRAPNPAMAPALPAIPATASGAESVLWAMGVDPALLGARVISSTGGTGAYAERVAVPSAGLLSVPKGLGLPAAVALLADGRHGDRPWSAAHRSGKAKTVLVEAAAGGRRKPAGASSRATRSERGSLRPSGEPRKLELAAELGAEMAVDYTEDGWAKLVRERIGGCVRRIRRRRRSGRPLGGSRSCAPVGASVGLDSRAGHGRKLPDADVGDVTVLRGTGRTPDESRELTRTALAEATAGRLRTVIGQDLPARTRRRCPRRDRSEGDDREDAPHRRARDRRSLIRD